MSGAHLDEWQRRSFDISSGSRTPEQTAEAYRAHVLSIQYAWASARLSPAGAARLLATYAERYASVLDSDDPQTGLNNYAEGALHLARSQRNHSDRWESALTAQSAAALPGVREMLRAGGGGGEAPSWLRETPTYLWGRRARRPRCSTPHVQPGSATAPVTLTWL